MKANLSPKMLHNFLNLLTDDNTKLNKGIYHLRSSKAPCHEKNMDRAYFEGTINQNNNMISDIKAKMESYT